MRLFGRKTTPFAKADGLAVLRSATLRAISVNTQSDFVDNDGTAEAMRAYLDRNLRETADASAHTLFHFQHNGRQIIPLFTSSQRLDEWLAKNPLNGTGVAAITVLTLPGTRLWRRFAGVPLTVSVVLDPMSDSERFLSHDELQTLARS